MVINHIFVEVSRVEVKNLTCFELKRNLEFEKGIDSESP